MAVPQAENSERGKRFTTRPTELTLGDGRHQYIVMEAVRNTASRRGRVVGCGLRIGQEVSCGATRNGAYDGTAQA